MERTFAACRVSECEILSSAGFSDPSWDSRGLALISVLNGPPPNSRPFVQTCLMSFLMVLDRSNYADGLVWTNGPNGLGVEFE